MEVRWWNLDGAKPAQVDAKPPSLFIVGTNFNRDVSLFWRKKTPILGQRLLIRATLLRKTLIFGSGLNTIIVSRCKFFPGNSRGIGGICPPKTDSPEFDWPKIGGNEHIQQVRRSIMLKQPKMWDLDRRRGDQLNKNVRTNLHQTSFL